jgi:CRISPR/Cas system CMR subunit Cmr4 (Cas7 group RAMP superfamily)|tara:strand:- start:58 stop:321 length:264 start_codon:yes stop_codon:yes gene_type:complete
MIFIKKEFREFLMWYCENQPRGTILKRKLDKFSQTEVEELKDVLKHTFNFFIEDLEQYQRGFIRSNITKGRSATNTFVPKDTYKRRS